MLARFELTGLEKHRPSQMSGGQQQRVALARIFLSEPDILMLDEPFSALDEYLRWNLEQELLEVLRQFSGPALFVSHSRDEIYRICGKACVMDQGTSSPVISVRPVSYTHLDVYKRQVWNLLMNTAPAKSSVSIVLSCQWRFSLQRKMHRRSMRPSMRVN